MDWTSRQTRAHLFLKWEQAAKSLEQYSSIFLSPSDLLPFGIQASQVGLTDDGLLQFEPCFFEPYPDAVLQTYPIHPKVDDFGEDVHQNHTLKRIPTLADALETIQKNPSTEDDEDEEEEEEDSDSSMECIPTFADALHVLQRNPPIQEDLLKAAYKLYRERIHNYYLWGHAEHGSWIHRYLMYQLEVKRDSERGLITLASLAGLQLSSRRFMDCPSSRWDIENLWRDRSGSRSPLPHLIYAISAEVDATITNQCLTLYEIQAVFKMVLIRARGSFRKLPIHPFLLFSYMGRQHGRITEVVVTQGQINLQYSPLWSFEVEEESPIEFFLRYLMSRPIGMERPVDASLLVDPVDDMHL